jgi:hypothetical protein
MPQLPGCGWRRAAPPSPRRGPRAASSGRARRSAGAPFPPASAASGSRAGSPRAARRRRAGTSPSSQTTSASSTSSASPGRATIGARSSRSAGGVPMTSRSRSIVAWATSCSSSRASSQVASMPHSSVVGVGQQPARRRAAPRGRARPAVDRLVRIAHLPGDGAEPLAAQAGDDQGHRRDHRHRAGRVRHAAGRGRPLTGPTGRRPSAPAEDGRRRLAVHRGHR